MQWIWSPTKQIVRKNMAGYEVVLEVPKIAWEGKWVQHD